MNRHEDGFEPRPRRPAKLRRPREDDEPDDQQPTSGFETARIKPTWATIHISDHAVSQFMDRAIEDGHFVQNRHLVVQRLKYLLLEGRRSDLDRSLLDELGPWLRWVQWTNQGRPVSLCVEKNSRLCCLFCRDKYNPEALVILTCFVAQDVGPLSKVPLRWT